MAIARVWIEEGCILCNACEAECPDVFLVTDTTCVIKAEVREDARESENRDERANLKTELRSPLAEGIKAAADGCPVEVIRFEEA